MIGLRWGMRLTGVVSTIILARLLQPSDFGVVAIAMIVVGMLEMLGQTGQKLALIRTINITPDHYNSAWTISALTGLIIGLSIYLVAPLTNLYFHDDRAILLMKILALRAVIGGLENIGTVDFRRDLNFNLFFFYTFIPKIVSFSITITAAILLQNYWSLVIGILSGQLALTVLSYVMHSHRPRFTFSKIPEIFSFSVWTYFKEIGASLSAQIDQIAVGGIAGASSMGRYAVAADVASSPSQEINAPMIAVLFPVMAKMQNDIDALRRIYLQTLGWSGIICASTSVGVAIVAPDMVRVLLGPQWVGLESLVVWLALAAGVQGLSGGSYTLFDALGVPRRGAQMLWVRLLLLGFAIFPVAFTTHNLEAIAATRFFLTAIFIPTLLFAVGRAVNISPFDFFLVLWRPIVAAALMASSVGILNWAFLLDGNWRLGVDVLFGAMVFGTSLITLWGLSGKPSSPESDLLTFCSRFRFPASEMSH
jgi:O-antigen/teichoic acid export membrane protein